MDRSKPRKRDSRGRFAHGRLILGSRGGGSKYSFGSTTKVVVRRMTRVVRKKVKKRGR